ncbi:hypothetical protein K456DRAFT_38324 [Colletotrichum gloeosporioides 23]|nr:hypothetical protein K456DRAFT_38324 [Colletotrichum gloeosporioides 23]
MSSDSYPTRSGPVAAATACAASPLKAPTEVIPTPEINTNPQPAEHDGVPTVACAESRSEPPATRRQRQTPPVVHTSVPVDDPTNTMPTSQDGRAESEGWHGPLQIRDRGSSSTDPESLILAEVGRLMAEYTRDIETNVRPTSTRRKAYYVVWKGRKRGVFTSWPQCMAQTSGFSGSRCMSIACVRCGAIKKRHGKDRPQPSRGHLQTAATGSFSHMEASLIHLKVPQPAPTALFACQHRS